MNIDISKSPGHYKYGSDEGNGYKLIQRRVTHFYMGRHENERWQSDPDQYDLATENLTHN